MTQKKEAQEIILIKTIPRLLTVKLTNDEKGGKGRWTRI